MKQQILQPKDIILKLFNDIEINTEKEKLISELITSISTEVKPNQTLQPKDRFVRLPEVKTTVGFGKSTIYAKISDGTFPKPIKLADRISVWKLTDIEKWMNEEIEAHENEVL